LTSSAYYSKPVLLFLAAAGYPDPLNFGLPPKIRRKMRPLKTLPNFRKQVSCRKKSG